MTNVYTRLVAADPSLITQANARNVSNYTTSTKVAAIYFMARKSGYTHPQAMHFIRNLTNSQRNDILFMGSGNRVMVNKTKEYFRKRLNGMRHNAAMNAVFLSFFNNR